MVSCVSCHSHDYTPERITDYNQKKAFCCSELTSPTIHNVDTHQKTECVPWNTLTMAQSAQIENSFSLPQFFLQIIGSRFERDIKTFSYNIEVGVVSGNSVKVHTVKKRYSELLLLKQEIEVHITKTGSLKLISTIAKIIELFPPKLYFFKKCNEKCLIKRKEMLNIFLSQLSRVPLLVDRDFFIDFFCISEYYAE